MIYKEKSHIFNLPLGVGLLRFCIKSFVGRYKDLAGFLTMEEEFLHKNKLVLTYLLGGVNVIIH